MSDSSSIHTIEELGHEDFSSSQEATTIRSTSDSEATGEITSSSYETDSWETATNSPRHSSTDSRRISISDDDDYSRRRRWRRTDGGERTSPLESKSSSYYSTHWDSSGTQTDSAEVDDARDKARPIQQHFLKSRLKHLKTSLHKPKIDDGEKLLQATQPGSEDSSVFCQKAISILERKKTNLDSQRRNQTLKRSPKDDKKMMVNREIVNRLKIENLLSTMKKVSSSPTTDTRFLSAMPEAVLQRTFIRNKTSKLENELTEQRVDWEMNTKDPLTAIGDLAQSLPKPSDDPEEIWARLLHQGIT